MIKFEDVIAKVGDMGTFQKRLIVLLLIIQLPVVFNTFLPLMILTMPKHRCALDNYPNDTYAVQSDHHRSLINESIPWSSDDERSTCAILRSKDRSATGPQEVKCDHYVYDKEYFGRTIIEELGIVCDEKEWRTHANMAMMMGKFMSALVQGVVSDLFGRRKALQGFIFVTIAAVFANAFIVNIPLLMVVRFIAGLTTSSIYLNGYVIAIEMFSMDYRNSYSFMLSMMWVGGAFVLDGLAYVIRDYQYLCVALATPTLFGLAAFWLVPESPRWLLSKGRVQEAKKVIEYIAKVNGKSFPEETFAALVEEEQNTELTEKDKEMRDGKKSEKGKKNESGNTDNVMSIFRYPILTLRFIIVIVNWIANSLTYYGILFNVQNLTGSIYLNFFLTTCVELVGKVVCLYAVDKFGRKRCYLASLGLAMLGCLASIFPPIYASRSDSDTLMIVLSMVGRLGIASSFHILYLYSTEVFPTTVRNRCMGISSMSSRVGSISAPYVADLGLQAGGSLTTALPLTIFGAAAFITWFLALILPETNKRKLPDTILDAANYGRKTKRSNDITLPVTCPEGDGLNGKEAAETKFSEIKSQNV